MKVRFYIEKRKGNNGELLTRQRPIFMTVAFHGKRVMITTGKFVDLQWWDHEKQRVREEHPSALILNMWLDDLERCANTVWTALAALSEKPGVDDFKREFRRIKPRFSGGFFDVFFLFMEEGSSRWSASTYRKHRSFYKLLKAFELEMDAGISFNSIDESFLQHFIAYQKGLGYKSLTISKSVNLLVWFLNWATKKGYNIYPSYKMFYKALEGEDYVRESLLYLEWEELMCLYDLVLTDTREERVRDIFCLMCFSGINFSELVRLKKEDIELERIFVRGGARKPRFVPLNKYSRAILDKYSNRYYREDRAFPLVSLVTFNKYLEVLGRRVNRVESRGERVEGRELRAGIATKTFIANALHLGIPAELISGFTGVKKDRRVQILKQELSKREMLKFDKI